MQIDSMRPFHPLQLIKPMMAAGVCAWAFGTWAQGAAVTPATSGSTLKADSAVKATPGPQSRPHWIDLSPSEQQALAPLKPQWQTISAAHKRKWLAMSNNFATMPPEEKNKLHARVQEWAQLSPQQRAQARLNFGESAQHSGNHKRAKWEAYQALSDEQRRKLADDILLQPPRGAALATRPVTPSKLTSPPSPRPDQVLQPRIDTDQIQPKTLLPQSLQGASTR